MKSYDTSKFGKTAITEFEDLSLQKEYTLKYFYCAWFKMETIFASTLEEAILDAKITLREETDKLNYALFCGKKRVAFFPAKDSETNNLVSNIWKQ